MMKKEHLFGTDGIRGQFGEFPLTENIIFAVSLALGKWLQEAHKGTKKNRIVIGKDTRSSCNQIEQYLAQGFTSCGIEVCSAGVIPTPGLAYLTNTMDVQMGVMISASHNSWTDNGIKFFKHNGYKLSEKQERAIEKIAYPIIQDIDNKQKIKHKKVVIKKVASSSYLEHLKNCCLGLELKGKKIVVDCANGAVSGYAEKLFSDLGANVFVLNDKPDGKNINLNCGSMHPEVAAQYLKKKKADIAFSFDGDADRVIFSDNNAKVLDGDYIMTMIVRYFLAENKLANNIVVGTSMSNFGLEKLLEKLEVRLIRADVGDKYVLEEIIKNKSSFGGEQSGHMIFLEYATTGDGMLTAVQILMALQKTKKSIKALCHGLKKYPQLIHNIKVRERRPFKKMPVVQQKIDQAQKQLNGRGRLVMRYSGTELLVRIMVEAENKKEIKQIAAEIGNAIAKEVGI
ncbi:MAG: phosphoglucosamine mutase [Candidatus Omnitrophica bacterium]|nr:phosphoglucosamine mutase [Candidatus Omnitrophota bacterium]